MSINLSKGEKINLAKEDGSDLMLLMVGLGWDPIKSGFFGNGGSIDLDASAVMLTEAGQLVDTVWFGQLQSNDGSIRHSGDNLTGHGDGDDETIKIDLSRVPANVFKIVVTINSYQGQTFDKVENCFCRLVDQRTNVEIFKYKLAEKGNHTGKIMCSIYRHNGKWKAQAIGQPMNGRTVRDLLPSILGAI